MTAVRRIGGAVLFVLVFGWLGYVVVNIAQAVGDEDPAWLVAAQRERRQEERRAARQAVIEDRLCAAWSTDQVTAYRQVRTERQYERVVTRHPEPAFSCAETNRQMRAERHARHRWYVPPTVPDGTEDGGGSVTVSACVGHLVRVCARS